MATIKLSSIKPNPTNPRLIKDERFHKLVKSIKEFPKMMELRPMVIDKSRVIIGGNPSIIIKKNGVLLESTGKIQVNGI